MGQPSDGAIYLDLDTSVTTMVGEVLQFLRAQSMPTYLVGGPVRDLLLGRQTHDLDVMVRTGGLDLARRLADRVGGAFVALDIQRDTGRAVFREPQGQVLLVDCAAWRADSLAQDLRLRDFTLNALAVQLLDGPAPVIDVVGGLEDIQHHLIRVVSPRSLPDDPLRGLRAVRLAAELAPLGFRLENETENQLVRYAHQLDLVAPERVRDELVRIVDIEKPGLWLQLAADLGQMAVVLPELEVLRGVGQSDPHRWGVFEHTLRTVDGVAWLEAWCDDQARLSNPAQVTVDRMLMPYRERLRTHLAQGEGASLRNWAHLLRWAALCHDWGKPSTRQVEKTPEGDVRVRFLGHEAVGADLTAKALRRLRFNEAEVRRVGAVVTNHMHPCSLAQARRGPSRRAVFRYYRATGNAGVDVALLSLADHWATYGTGAADSDFLRLLAVVTRLLQDFFDHHAQVVSPSRLVDGNDLMAALGLSSGPEIGALLLAIGEAQADGDVKTREQALAYAARLHAEGRPAY
jgi:tRNA nucleotidyltransferase/poly(A) polymerase